MEFEDINGYNKSDAHVNASMIENSIQFIHVIDVFQQRKQVLSHQLETHIRFDGKYEKIFHKNFIEPMKSSKNMKQWISLVPIIHWKTKGHMHT